jgi:ATP-dependent Lhr-like helicase
VPLRLTISTCERVRTAASLAAVPCSEYAWLEYAAPNTAGGNFSDSCRHSLSFARAPTAGGKTEAAIIPILSRMLNESWPATSVLHICPNQGAAQQLGAPAVPLRRLVGRHVEIWHGDISQSRKTRAMKNAPDILLTTPESIEGMLISTRVNRASWFGSLHSVIVDELHAFAADDRGGHLRSVRHRLDQYLGRPLQRIGLSATVSNPSDLLRWFAPRAPSAVVGSPAVSTDADVTIDHVGSLDNAETVISRLHRGEEAGFL